MLVSLFLGSIRTTCTITFAVMSGYIRTVLPSNFTPFALNSHPDKS
ncbi:unnamed protein product [Chondrus crispus]|uniref:Uncharacterized protein n=1 Tax=Chondrus crispus TaxID=2769 RepID=R7QNP5_CHOCR|nr:unnamed protein product [Chondrus crispus]CDF39729.1 unnamed protein product [Chondrus crispus]|eukprot:XP_005710023.1 unnamed protein product [Chondrus crispus]